MGDQNIVYCQLMYQNYQKILFLLMACNTHQNNFCGLIVSIFEWNNKQAIKIPKHWKNHII